MKSLKKVLCLSLALLMLLMTLSACKTDEDTQETGSESVTASESWEIDFWGKDYGGHVFTVLRANTELEHKWTGHANDVWVEEISGDILGNAVYNRNQALKEMLKIDVAMELAKVTELATTLNTSVLSGESTYDLVIPQISRFPELINLGLIKDMTELSLDTSYSWWDKQAENAMKIGGKQYGMISDIIYVDKLSTIGVFFNTTMAENLKLPNLYEMVDKGEWTLEKMKEYSKIANESGENVYGISCQNDFSYFILHSANINTVSKDNNGNLVYRLPYQRPVNVLQHAFTIMNESYFFNRQEHSLQVDETVQRFGLENLFLIRPLQTFYYMKEYYEDYGVLPMPRYDEVYEGYYSPINHMSAIILTLPKNNNEPARTADVLQAWGMISEKVVNPEFYDRILSTRMVKNPESSRMLDIIFGRRVYDVGLIFDFGSVESIVLIRNKFAIEKAPGTIASTISGSKESVTNSIKDYFDKIK